MAYRKKIQFNRVSLLILLSIIATLAIVVKLIYLQIMRHDYYAAKAADAQLGYTEIEARRGEILIEDTHSGEQFRLATNMTLDLLYADPTLVKDPVFLTEKIAPLVFDMKEEREKETKRIRLARRALDDNPSEDALKTIQKKTDDELFDEFRANMLERLSQKTRQSLVLMNDPDEELIDTLKRRNLSGIEATTEAVTAYPPKIGDPEYTANVLAPLVDIPKERLKEILVGRNRYYILHQKLPPNISAQLKQIIADDENDLYRGIGFQEKTYRFYPEGELAAQVLGFVAEQGGVYGIEGRFDNQLRGTKGIFKTQLDGAGQQITVGDDLIIAPPVAGDTIVLAIDRSIQREAERLLAHRVTVSNADSGQVIVMDPETGRILALAHFPTFDPNDYAGALETEDFTILPEEKSKIIEKERGDDKEYWYEVDADTHNRIRIFKTTLENGKEIFERYKNKLGSGAYLNKAVSEIYEPGSVFKVIAMAIALNDGDVTPTTTFYDSGPIEVDEFTIHNSLDRYFGTTTMTKVIEESLNTGMAFVARKMGRNLFYSFIKKFGFGERTDIEFDNENAGQVKHGARWAESELVTHAFGQGIAVTPIQMITAVSALANDGILVQPHIVQEVIHGDGTSTVTEPRALARVISSEAAKTISAMMISAVENGVAPQARVPGYRVAGKTGTSQTYKNGKPLTGSGTTVASFAGFGPGNDPKFAILIKIDHPRTSIWGSDSAAPLFSDMSKFLFGYYNIPPEN